MEFGPHRVHGDSSLDTWQFETHIHTHKCASPFFILKHLDNTEGEGGTQSGHERVNYVHFHPTHGNTVVLFSSPTTTTTTTTTTDPLQLSHGDVSSRTTTEVRSQTRRCVFHSTVAWGPTVPETDEQKVGVSQDSQWQSTAVSASRNGGEGERNWE